MNAIYGILSNPIFLYVWLAQAFICVAVLIYDLIRNNRQLGSLMKVVWVLTVSYSGALGLLIYFYSGRRQISDDSLWRKGFRSVAHCYSGCGAGEVVGVFIAAGLLSLNNLGVGLVTFALAYVAGFALTMGPLIQEGETFRNALWDAFTSETASITVMEIVAIGVDLWLAGGAKMHDVLFWSSLVVSLTAGLVAAYPVNVILIQVGVKEGMHNPKMTHAHGQ